MEETVGQFLKRSREKKGVSLEEAAEKTRIRLSYLKALEEDDLKNLPGSVYTRGFLHNYAQFLGIEELAEQYQQEQLLANLLSEEEKSGRLPRRKGIILATGVLLVSVVSLLLYYSLKSPSPEAIRYILKDNLVSEKEKPLVPPPKEILEEENILAKEEQSQKLEKTQDDLLPEKEKKESSEVAFTRTLSPKGQEEEDLVLFASATEKVWIRVFVDQKDTFTFLLYPSEKKTFRAREEIKIRIGNAGGLLLKLNDKDLGLLGKSGQVINRIFTRKDLLPHHERIAN